MSNVERLYEPEDVTCVQAYDELPFVIELFYKGELFFQVHVGRTANRRSFLGA